LLGVSPEAFELVEVAQGRMKDVDDEIHEVEQNPPAALESFHVVCGRSFLLHPFHDVLADRASMRVGGSTGDDEEVGHVRHSSQVEEDDVLCLRVERDLSSALGESE
jgi:hypothetical protein